MDLLSLSLAIFCILTFSITSFHTILAKDAMTPFQRLKDGQTLLSANRRFELGFFSPAGQTSIRYLGIWYNGIAPLTFVWVANRKKPLRKTDANLMLESNGSLMLLDHTHNPIFISLPAKNASKPVLQILDSGNLIVRDENSVSGGGYLWQSFDYPSDTLLPGMKIGWNYKSGRNLVLTSWKNIDDPSPGELILGLDNPQLPQLVLERNSIKQSRWGPWDGVRFSGSDAFGTNPLIHPAFMTNPYGVYFRFDVLDESVLVRFIVTQLGKVQFLSWKKNTSQWIPVVTLNKDFCDGYNTCGPYGICFLDEPKCRCLKGFAPNSSRNLRGMASAYGCKRTFERKCDVGEGFTKFKGLKLPDKATVWPKLSSKQCENNCLQECSCNAYSYIDIYENGSNCVVWLNELFDMRNLHRGGDDLHIRMAQAELESIASAKKHRKQALITVVIVSSLSALVFSGFLSICCSRIRNATRQDEHQGPLPRNRDANEENLEFRLFDIHTISTATNNFSNYNKIGEGGFGPVYKGELHNGREIAVKRLSSNSRQGQEQFENESGLIARLQHRNLVKLFGCCVHEEERMLIYEYLPNKSLDKFIFDQARKMLLSWATRVDIIIGIAKGLAYLHDDSGLRIVHRDLKASNILLDSEMTPKISDFGLAKILGEDTELEERTMKVYGTYGYLSPEYAMHGQFSTKSDVFSFGVLVLEIISGKKNWGFQHPEHDMNLLGHGWNLWREGKAVELMDPTPGDPFSVSVILRCIQVGLLCAQHTPEQRPTMSTVVCMLSNETMDLPEPMVPGFFPQTSSPSGSYGRPLSVSVSGLTVTTLTAR